MNILILVNPAKNYKYFFYNVAKSLADLGHSVYYAYDTEKNKILFPIPEIDESSKSYFFDVFFKNNQDESFQSNDDFLFDCTWGEYFYSDFDRFLTHGYNLDKDAKEWVKIRKKMDGFFYKILTEKNIDLVLYENISNSFEYSAYRVAQTLGKKYFGLIASRIPGRYEIQTSIIDDLLVDLEQVKKKPLTEEEISWYKDYKSNINKIEPDYMKQNGLDNVSLLNKVSSNIIYKILRSIKADIKYGANSDYASGLLFLRILSALKVAKNRRLNHKKTKKYFLKVSEVNEIKQQHRFYVYPMHYHPESSTSVLAPQYTNEYHNILNISNNLPFGQYLYVKDHRSAIGLNSDDFYRKISALPAVRLIPAEYNIKDLIKYSAGVITVNSTAGYEALILGKPVYLLGNVFYQNFSNVVRLQNFDNLKSCLEKSAEFVENAADIVAYRRVTYEGILNFNMVEYDKNKHFYDQLSQNIADKMSI